MLGNVKVGRASRDSWLVGLTTTPNLQKIRERQLAAPAESGTLQALVVNELGAKTHKATEGLVWLNRYGFPPRASLVTSLPGLELLTVSLCPI
jgi:hypothetical protein